MKKYDIKGGNCNIKFDGDVAIKYLRNTSSKDKIKRFKQELEIFQNLKNKSIPNLVEIHDIHINEEQLENSYLKMKKYNGSLYDLYKKTKGDVRYSLSLILPIIKTLKVLSEQKPSIYHRDIKPDNILYLKKNNEYELYLTDFGIAYINDNINPRITEQNISIGPRMFLSPEYEIGKVENITEKGDIYSIGKVIWCMINGIESEFLPSNFWFLDEYNLCLRYKNNADMIFANIIISACLAVNPEERCSYDILIKQIEEFLNSDNVNKDYIDKYKVKQYHEKRILELKEIKQKNKLLVNNFSICYINVLKKLNKLYPDLELIKKLYIDYSKKATDGINYASKSVEENINHYLYSGKFDKIYVAINYMSAGLNEKYCKIIIHYWISQLGLNKKYTIFYDSENNVTIRSDYLNANFNENTLLKILQDMIIDYITD